MVMAKQITKRKDRCFMVILLKKCQIKESIE